MAFGDLSWDAAVWFGALTFNVKIDRLLSSEGVLLVICSYMLRWIPRLVICRRKAMKPVPTHLTMLLEAW